MISHYIEAKKPKPNRCYPYLAKDHSGTVALFTEDGAIILYSFVKEIGEYTIFLVESDFTPLEEDEQIILSNS